MVVIVGGGNTAGILELTGTVSGAGGDGIKNLINFDGGGSVASYLSHTCWPT